MTQDSYQYPAFSGFGIELEYAIVDRSTLRVRPIADALLDGADDMDVPRGDAAWSNELALHVIEIKTAGPAADLQAARSTLRREVDELNRRLSKLGAQLMPTGMHPLMDPLRETKLWPHQNNEIYRSFDRIFDCKGHGWSNLQSMHINLPFGNESEFERLHAACRLVLPLLPAIAASSPYWEGHRAPHLDQRLAVYQTNCRRVASVTGQVIPEAVFSYAEYQELLHAMYRDIAPFDPAGILQEEWLNARGAIARFDRGAVEIRVLDTQECPEQDLAIAEFVTTWVKALYDEEFCSLDVQKEQKTDDLARLFQEAVRKGGAAAVPADYSALFGTSAATLSRLAAHLFDRLIPVTSTHHAAMSLIIEDGTLSERIVRSVEGSPAHSVEDVYAGLCSCLKEGRAFFGSGR